MGFICPHKFFNAKYGSPLRSLVATGNHLSQVVHFGDQQVFDGATTYTCLLFLDKSPVKEVDFTKVADIAAWHARRSGTHSVIKSNQVTNREWNFAVGPGSALFQRLFEMPVRLKHVSERIFQGLKTGSDKVYIVRELQKSLDRTKVYSDATGAEHWIESALLHPLVKGGDSKAFALKATTRLVIFPYAAKSGSVELISPLTMRDSFPLAWEYLSANKESLQSRERGRTRGENWYAYTRNQALEVMPLPKIFTPDLSTRSAFSLDKSGDLFFTGGVAGGYGLLISSAYSREYILGLLNSRLLDWLHHQVSTQMRGGWYSYESRFIRDLPIRTIDVKIEADRIAQDRLVSLVNSILSLHEHISKTRSSAAIERHSKVRLTPRPVRLTGSSTTFTT